MRGRSRAIFCDQTVIETGQRFPMGRLGDVHAVVVPAYRGEQQDTDKRLWGWVFP